MIQQTPKDYLNEVTRFVEQNIFACGCIMLKNSIVAVNFGFFEDNLTLI
jgi:hypothetical protein